MVRRGLGVLEWVQGSFDTKGWGWVEGGRGIFCNGHATDRFLVLGMAKGFFCNHREREEGGILLELPGGS